MTQVLLDGEKHLLHSLGALSRLSMTGTEPLSSGSFAMLEELGSTVNKTLSRVARTSILSQLIDCGGLGNINVDFNTVLLSFSQNPCLKQFHDRDFLSDNKMSQSNICTMSLFLLILLFQFPLRLLHRF